jgi:trans-aconitate methyltransferase
MSKKQHWEQVYTDKTPVDVSWFQQQPTISLSLINSLQLSKDAAIIDVGGGASRLVDQLLADGYHNLAVLDISAQVLAHSQSRLAGQADQVEWFVEDITKFSPSRKFDLWHDRAVFHFLTDATDRQHYVANLQAALVPQGHVVIATFAIGGPTKCSNLDIAQYDEAKMCAELGDDFVLRSVQHELHITPANKEQLFIYFHLQKK